MAQYNDTLSSMRGLVKNYKQNAPNSLITGFLNQAVRSAINKRPFWSALLKIKAEHIPAAYSTGSIALTTASDLVTGTATDWPVDDVVNTVSPQSVDDLGMSWVYPASMAGITDDMMLYIDTGGDPEIVAVRQVDYTGFKAVFQKQHDIGFTITSSRLANRQLRITNKTPVFTISAVTSPTTLILDQPWQGQTMTGSSYQILRSYLSISPLIKMPMHMVDPVSGRQLQINQPQAKLMAMDPWRQSVGDPVALFDQVPGPTGNMRYELYPPPTTERQYLVMYSEQWPEMVDDGDRPPSFIDPAVFTSSALSAVLRNKVEVNDPFVDVNTANFFEGKFQEGLIDAINADNHKAQMAFSAAWEQMGGVGGANFWQSHDPDAYYGNV